MFEPRSEEYRTYLKKGIGGRVTYMKRTFYGTECDAFEDQRKVSVAGSPWSWGSRKEFLGQGKNSTLPLIDPVLKVI